MKPHLDPTVCAIVVSHNNAGRLGATLDALLRQRRPLDRIVVVDNGSTDETSDVVASRSDIELLQLGDNLGPAGGFAAGMRAAASSNFALLATDDDVLMPEALGRLIDVADRHGAHSMVGAGVVLDGRRWLSGSRMHRGSLRRVTSIQPGTTEYEVDTCTFAGLLVPMSVVETAGPVRGDLFMMWEEYDFCLRARQNGFRVIVVADALSDGGPTTPAGGYPPWREYYQARNWMLSIRHRRAWAEVIPWGRLQAKYLVSAARRPDRNRRLGLRLRGMLDGVRGCAGRTVDPD